MALVRTGKPELQKLNLTWATLFEQLRYIQIA